MSEEEEVPAVAAAAQPTEEEPAPRLTGAELTEALKQQVEYYFTKANLQNNAFLVSRMDSQMTVPLTVVAQLAKIKALTDDEAAIAASVADSTVCTVTPSGIRPNVKAERNTIILREIASDTPPALLQEVLSGEGIAPIKGLRSDVGDTWFVTCGSEAEAMSTIMALRNKTFDGKPIKARLKGENILRSFFPVPTAAEVPAAFQTSPMVGGGPMAGMPMNSPYGMVGGLGSRSPNMMNGHPQQPYGFPLGGGVPPIRGGPMYGGLAAQQGQPMGGLGGVGFPGGLPLHVPQQGQPRGGIPQSQRQPQQYQQQQQQTTQKSGQAQGGIGGNAAGGVAGVNQKENSASSPPQQPAGGSADKSKTDRTAKIKGGKKAGEKGPDVVDQPTSAGTASAKAKGAHQQNPLSSANFPPLAGSAASPGTEGEGSAAASNVGVAAERTIPPAGYQGSFHRYKPDEILKIVSGMSREDVASGASEAEGHPLVMDLEPDLGLLLRQRSVSIDEVRELMRRGRPVHREATLPSGGHDYSNFMYGDNAGAGAATGSPPGAKANGPHGQNTAEAKEDSGSHTQRGGGSGAHKGSSRRAQGAEGSKSPHKHEGGHNNQQHNRKGGRGHHGHGHGQHAHGHAQGENHASGNADDGNAKPMGAYAAAVLKAPPPQPQAATPPVPPSGAKKAPAAANKGKESKGSKAAAPEKAERPEKAPRGKGDGSKRNHSSASPNRGAGGNHGGKGEGGRGNNQHNSNSHKGTEAAAPRPARGWEKPPVKPTADSAKSPSAPATAEALATPAPASISSDSSSALPPPPSPSASNPEPPAPPSTLAVPSSPASNKSAAPSPKESAPSPVATASAGSVSASTPPAGAVSAAGAGAAEEKPSGGAWGAKKRSFLDAVKTAPAAPAPTSNSNAASSGTSSNSGGAASKSHRNRSKSPATAEPTMNAAAARGWTRDRGEG